MERICIAALTFFNAISYHTADSIIYFCVGNSSAQQKFYFMENFKVEILNSFDKSSVCTVLVESMSLIDVVRSFIRSGYLVLVHPLSFSYKV